MGLSKAEEYKHHVELWQTYLANSQRQQTAKTQKQVVIFGFDFLGENHFRYNSKHSQDLRTFVPSADFLCFFCFFVFLSFLSFYPQIWATF